jgi:uncharacterized protein (DUF1697 family)
MKALAAMAEKAGAQDVQTYIQSGNLVFKAEAAAAKALPAKLGAAIAKGFGFEVPLILRSGEELAALAKRNPFLKKGADLKSLHLGFLADKPRAAQIKSLDKARCAPGEAFEVLGSEVYFHFPLGLAKTKLTNAYFDSKLSSTMTVRNWNTVLKLVEMTS